MVVMELGFEWGRKREKEEEEEKKKRSEREKAGAYPFCSVFFIAGGLDIYIALG